jgi:hypothetical protein
LVLPIIAYTLSSTKLEIREEVGGIREGLGEMGRNDSNMYAHMNKIKIKKKSQAHCRLVRPQPIHLTT